MTLGPLMVDVAGTELTAEDRRVLKHPLVGSVILFTRNYESVPQLEKLVAEIRAVRKPPLIVTVDHVLPRPDAGEATVQVMFDGETPIPVNVINGDSDVDVGLLHCPYQLPIRPMSIAQEPCVGGDIIAIIGAPEGWPDVVTVGRVSGTDMTPAEPPDPSWTDMMFVDAHILEGSSGSMVIDVTGRVVGIVMGLIGKKVEAHGTGQNAVVPAHRILRAIQSIIPQS